MTCAVYVRKADPDFVETFERVLNMKREQSQDVNAQVYGIINQVVESGDDALFALTEKFDGVTLTSQTVRFSKDEIDAAESACDPEALEALDFAAKRISDFHQQQKPEDNQFIDADGVTLGHRWTAVDAAGLYVPGGTANYPSSVLMNALPAKVAGVRRLVMSVPTPNNVINPLVLAAAKRAGVDEIYRVGGAQAIAAMAYGTTSMAPVNVIVGPGNAYVAAAKKQVFGVVGIDMIAGPSEILVVSDRNNDPSWIAADLLSQAEHDRVAQSILICDDENFASRVEAAIESHLVTLSRSEIARESWENFGVILIVDDLQKDAPDLINALAPEHLELAVEAPESLADHIRHAGAIFMGRYTPEAIGDYVAGPNHVLPTARAARYASGLSVLNFMKRTSIVGCDVDALTKIGPAALKLADVEGLDAHARSISIRLNMNE
jgi:histidinol dehydrogenase